MAEWPAQAVVSALHSLGFPWFEHRQETGFSKKKARFSPSKYPQISVTSGTSPVAQMVKRLPTIRETWVQSLGWEDILEREMATHSNALAWRIPWAEKPGRLQSMGSQGVGHDWATFTYKLVRFFELKALIFLHFMGSRIFLLYYTPGRKES